MRVVPFTSGCQTINLPLHCKGLCIHYGNSARFGRTFFISLFSYALKLGINPYLPHTRGFGNYLIG